jgi:hypothetical protein
LHQREFIETRRHRFTKKEPHDTGGGVNVLNLVEGEEALVESPTHAFAPFLVHYAETFIIPAKVGSYTIRPYGSSVGRECATLKAYVRTGVPEMGSEIAESRLKTRENFDHEAKGSGQNGSHFVSEVEIAR